MNKGSMTNSEIKAAMEGIDQELWKTRENTDYAKECHDAYTALRNLVFNEILAKQEIGGDSARAFRASLQGNRVTITSVNTERRYGKTILRDGETPEDRDVALGLFEDGTVQFVSFKVSVGDIKEIAAVFCTDETDQCRIETLRDGLGR